MKKRYADKKDDADCEITIEDSGKMTIKITSKSIGQFVWQIPLITKIQKHLERLPEEVADSILEVTCANVLIFARTLVGSLYYPPNLPILCDLLSEVIKKLLDALPKNDSSPPKSGLTN